MKWPGIKPIEFISLYLETGGKLSEHNIQILSDVGEHLALQGCLYCLGGEFQVDSSWLEDMEWVKQIKGRLRVGDRRIGTCASATPATTIDDRVVRQNLKIWSQEHTLIY